MINICYSLGEISDVAYTKEISISMRSICENTKEPLNFFILLDGTLNQSVVDCILNDFLNVYSNVVGINYIDCVLPDKVHMSEYTLNRFKKASMFRLCLPSVLPKIKKIIYLDADVIFDEDIVKLWNTDVDYLGAVYKKLTCPNKNLKCYCEVENHFCSGIMVMNLEKIRDKIEDLFDVPSELYTACWLDQCILNYWFCDYATPLWLHKIYHYHGDLKPNCVVTGKTDLYYWKYVDEPKDEIIRKLIESPNIYTVYESLRMLPLKKIIFIMIKIGIYKTMRK